MILFFFFIIFYTKKERRQSADEFSATEAKKEESWGIKMSMAENQVDECGHRRSIMNSSCVVLFSLVICYGGFDFHQTGCQSRQVLIELIS